MEPILQHCEAKFGGSKDREYYDEIVLKLCQAYRELSKAYKNLLEDAASQMETLAHYRGVIEHLPGKQGG